MVPKIAKPATKDVRQLAMQMKKMSKTMFLWNKQIILGKPKSFPHLVEPVEAGKGWHGCVASAEGEEDLPGGVNPDLEVQELLRIRLDVKLNTLIVVRE